MKKKAQLLKISTYFSINKKCILFNLNKIILTKMFSFFSDHGTYKVNDTVQTTHTISYLFKIL